MSAGLTFDAGGLIALERIDRRVIVLLARQLLGSPGTTDLADAHVIVCARRSRSVVVTPDAGDLHRLDPTIELIEV